jgi:DNA-binding response OmpR family regulator
MKSAHGAVRIDRRGRFFGSARRSTRRSPCSHYGLSAAAEESPDLLITDVIMPDMNGVDLAIHFKNLYPRCKILLFSAAASTLDLLDDARLRGYDFELLDKPLHPVKLLERLRAL